MRKASIFAIAMLLCITVFHCNVSAGGSSLVLQWTFATGARDVNDVDMSENGSYIVAGGGDFKVYFFKRESPTPLWSYETTGSVASVDITPDAKYVAVAARDKIYVFDSSGNKLWENYLYDPYSGPTPDVDVEDVAISHDGSYVVAVGGDNLCLYNKTGDLLWTVFTPTYASYTYLVAISSDGQYIAITDSDGVVTLYNVAGQVLWYKELIVYSGIAISEDGSYIAASGDGAYLLSRNGEIVWSYPNVGGAVVDISADGNYVAIGDFNTEKTYLYSREENTILWSYQTGQIEDVAISKDKSRIVSSGFTGIYLFATTGELLGSYPVPYEGDSFLCTAISANGAYIAAGCQDGKVYFFSSNNPPTITSGKVYPLVGYENATFTYEAIYKDIDNDPPAYVKVYIDSVGHNMSYMGGEYQTGAKFQYQTKLNPGYHYYYFETLDARGGYNKTIEFSGPYVIPQTSEYTFNITVDGITFPIKIFSNSYITDFTFNKAAIQISFMIYGETGTQGYCNITIPKAYIKGEPWIVKLNQTTIDHILTQNQTHYSIYINYTFTSLYHVTIKGTWVIPEFPSNIIILPFMLITAITLIMLKRKRQKPLNSSNFSVNHR
ncbi:MAG: PQQ-binding-like beta-propeller repeat protein [Candidatus Bathyarchaeia archaeon]